MRQHADLQFELYFRRTAGEPMTEQRHVAGPLDGAFKTATLFEARVRADFALPSYTITGDTTAS